MTHSLLFCFCVALFYWAMNFSLCLSAPNKTIYQSVASTLLFWHWTWSSLVFSFASLPLCVSSCPLRVSLKLYVSTPCYCTALWFWITSHCIVILYEVCHYGSSLSVDRWTCCGVVKFNFPCLWLSLSKSNVPASYSSLPVALFGKQKMPAFSSSGL